MQSSQKNLTPSRGLRRVTSGGFQTGEPNEDKPTLAAPALADAVAGAEPGRLRRRRDPGPCRPGALALDLAGRNPVRRRRSRSAFFRCATGFELPPAADGARGGW